MCVPRIYEQPSMSFSHFEKAMIVLRPREEWSSAVAAEVQARYDAFGAAQTSERSRTSQKEHGVRQQHEMRNFVFMPNVGYTNTTAFVSYFRVSELEYCMLEDLGAFRVPTEAETRSLKSEYLGQDYPLSPKAKEFAHARIALFGTGDFSRTTVLDMKSLVGAKGGAFYVFYKQYYLPAVNLCGRQEAPRLHSDMTRLGLRLYAEAQAAEAAAAAADAEAADAEAAKAEAAAAAGKPGAPTPEMFGVRRNPAPSYIIPPYKLPYDAQLWRRRGPRLRESPGKFSGPPAPERFACAPTPALLGVRKNPTPTPPYTIARRPLEPHRPL